MAKRLGFQPGALVRAIPSPQQKWKLPVKLWIHDLYVQRFGLPLLGEKPIVLQPPTPEEESETARRFEEELYWEDYHERNRDDRPSAPRSVSATQAGLDRAVVSTVTDGDVPF
jgi:hypothetical protein